MTGRAIAAILALASLAGTVAPAAATGAESAPSASLGSFVCHQASSPLNRKIGVTATMRSVPGTVRMELRFQLLERQPGQPFYPARGGDLGSWLHPTPATFGQLPGDTWSINKPVANLAAPAVYRFKVTFRWVGSDGVIATAVRRGPLCVQSQ